MAPIVIGIAGGSRNLGSIIVKALLSEEQSRQSVGRVLVLTRDPTSEKLKALEALGAEALQVGETVSAEDLRGVDVFIDTSGHTTPGSFKDSCVKAASEAGVKVYLLNEFGSDHRTSTLVHEIWTEKKKREAYARSLGGDTMKVISLYTGYFTEDAVKPWIGFDTPNKLYTSVGPATTRTSFTSKVDIARAVARLAVLATQDPANVPDHVRISGDAKSFAELAEIMGAESGDKIVVEEIDWNQFKDKLDREQGGKGNPLGYLRLAAGSGDADFSAQNHNELVNPGQSLWTWKTMEDFARETKGRPFP